MGKVLHFPQPEVKVFTRRAGETTLIGTVPQIADVRETLRLMGVHTAGVSYILKSNRSGNWFIGLK